MGAHESDIDAHSDAHEEQGEQQSAKRLDIGFQLVPIIRLREQDAGEKSPQPHRHAHLLHDQRRAQDDQQRGGRHHLARSTVGQQTKKWIQQIAPGEHDERNCARDEGHCPCAMGVIGVSVVVSLREQGQQREQRNHGHVLEQENGKGALPVGLLQLSAILQDLQRDRGGGNCQRQPRDDRPAPAEQAEVMGERCDCQRGQRQLGGAEAEDGTTHREQLTELELEADQEQQHHHAQFGDRDDALGSCECREPRRADDHASDEISDECRQSNFTGNGHAENRGDKQHETKRKKAEFAELLRHVRFRGWPSRDPEELQTFR